MGYNGYPYEVAFKDPGIANAIYVRYRSHYQSKSIPIGNHVKQNGRKLNVSDDAHLMLENIIAQIERKQGRVNLKVKRTNK